MKPTAGTALVLVLTATLTACGGARARVQAKSDLVGPASFTSSVYDARGRVLRGQGDLSVVGKIDKTHTSWGILFGLIPLARTWDLSPMLNEGMRSASGDAIVNIRVSATSNSLLNYLATLIPVLPCYTTVRVQGDVVRVTQR